MITLEEAIKTVENNMPDCNVFSCSENNTFYFFVLQPKRLAGTDEVPYGGSSYVIWKNTGKFDLIDFDTWDKEKYDRLVRNDRIKKIDLTKRAS